MSTVTAVHPVVERLAQIQVRDGLTQTEMAKRLGIDVSVCSRLLAGRVQPSVRVIGAIARGWPELREACVAAVFDEAPGAGEA